jgi:hypothetical protein
LRPHTCFGSPRQPEYSRCGRERQHAHPGPDRRRRHDPPRRREPQQPHGRGGAAARGVPRRHGSPGRLGRLGGARPPSRDHARRRPRASRDGERGTGWWDAALRRLPPGATAEELGAYAIENRATAPAGLRELVDNLVGRVKAFLLRRFGAQLGAVTLGQLRAHRDHRIMRRGQFLDSPMECAPGIGQIERLAIDRGRAF